MTVIAYSVEHGELAADSAVWKSNSQIIHGFVKKIYRLGDGRLFAAWGRSCDIEYCAKWLESGGLSETKPAAVDKDDFGGLLIGPLCDDVFLVEYDFRPYRAHHARYYVAGAHGDFLMGAMLAGATPFEAVRLAIGWGDSAGGEIQVEQI
jgi:hypothetical protein